MSRALCTVVLTVAAACGGSAPIVQPVANAVAPPSVESPAQHLVAIQTLAKKACACPDRICLADIDRELAALVRAIELDPRQALHEEQGKESLTALEALSVCMTDRQVSSPEFGRAIVDRYGELAELRCGCVDDECRSKLTRTLPEAPAAFYFPLEDDAYTEWEKISKRGLSCGGNTPETAQARAIRELTALRDAACACEDADCAEQVQAGFDAFLEDHKDTQGSQQDAATIGALAREMSECLADAMPASP